MKFKINPLFTVLNIWVSSARLAFVRAELASVWVGSLAARVVWLL